jgi:hypothetical protein
MTKPNILAIFLILALASCQKAETLVDEGNPVLIGSWVNPEYNDTLVTYTRANNLLENQYGITFKPGNKLVDRQNSGWCGTPPISTADYEGTWTQKDSIVNITVGFWGGTVDYTWEIISLYNHKLVIKIVKSEYHQGG